VLADGLLNRLRPPVTRVLVPAEDDLIVFHEDVEGFAETRLLDERRRDADGDGVAEFDKSCSHGGIVAGAADA